MRVAPAAPPASQTETPTADEPERIVLAEVNGEPVTLAEAIQVFLSSHTGHGVLVRGEPAVRDLTGRLVERALFLSEADALGIPADEEVVDVVRAYGRELAANEYWEREVVRKVNITDEDVEAFYAKTDVAVKLTLIETADRASAEDLRARAAAGEDMASMARKFSIHPSRTFDGATAYVRRGELERALEEVTFALEEPGSLTPVVATEKGFAFARLDERTLNPDRPAREVAIPQIRGILVERATKRNAAEVEERALQAAEVWYDDEHLTLEQLLDGPDPSIVVVRAAGDHLTLQDLRDAVELDAVRAAPLEQTEDLPYKIARQWTRAEALKLAAERAGLLADPVVVQKQTTFSRDVVMKVLCRRYVWPQEPPTEEEVRSYYDENLELEFTRPPEVRLAYMVLATEADALAARARLEAGEEFETVAREASIDARSAVHGGRIGWIKRGDLLPEVEARALALQVGTIDGPVATEVGQFLLKALDRKEARVVPYSFAQATALKRLTERRQREAYGRWAVALRERAEVSLNEEGVKAAVVWLDAEGDRRAAEQAAKPAAELPAGHGPRPEMPGSQPEERNP